jgi:membrane fusion protein (multidrug efflux system)
MPSRFEISLTEKSTIVVSSESLTWLPRCRSKEFLLPLLLFTLLGCEKKEAAAPPSPPEVIVAQVVQQDVPIYGEWVSQLNGPVNVDITPKVQGYLLRQTYQNGFFVKKGELLFELDPRQYQADLDQAKAQVSQAEADLARFDADVQRDTPLAAQNAIPQKELDTDLANQAAMRSLVEAKKAALQNAQLNLGWTKIYSPIEGIAGVSNSQIGDLVGTNTKMVTVSQVDPIWAYFNVSESLFLSFAPQLTRVISGKISPAALRKSPVEFIQANDVPYPRKGAVIYVNRQVGTQTGTIQMAAEFPNPDAVLRPGGYGRARVRIGENKQALLVPQASVIEVQSQYQILVVTPDNKAKPRPIKVGDRVGTNWIVTDGLKAGERVVVEGIQKVQTFAAQVPEMAKEGVPVVPKASSAAAATASAGGSN